VELFEIAVLIMDADELGIFFVNMILLEDNVFSVIFSIDDIDVIEVFASLLSMFFVKTFDATLFNINKRVTKRQ
jgi:hypothetical protein